MNPQDRAVLAELARRERMRGPGGLMEFVPYASPQLREPRHLARYVELLERARTETVHACVSVPPRHAKTETTLHAIAWWLAQDPTEQIAYISYNAEIAQEKSARAKAIAQSVGVRLAGMQTQGRWEVKGGGSVVATGIRGALTSRGFTKIIVDDHIAGHEEAESPTIREKNWNGFMADVQTRADPRGTSIFNIQTRWHRGDLAGRLVREMGWPEINLPALDDAGEALWPEVWSREWLEKQRDGTAPYVWTALYQGRPVARGASLFGDPHYYDTLPDSGYRVALGVDLAYTRRSASDWSIAVVLMRHAPPNGAPGSERYYVLDVVRRQCRAPEFAQTLKALSADHGHATARWYCSGTEIGSADFVRDLGVRIDALPTTADKFVRAMPVSAAWNAGKVLVPRKAPWLRPFLDVVQGFTGVDDDHDDDVDALAAGFDQLYSPQANALRGFVAATR